MIKGKCTGDKSDLRSFQIQNNPLKIFEKIPLNLSFREDLSFVRFFSSVGGGGLICFGKKNMGMHISTTRTLVMAKPSHQHPINAGWSGDNELSENRHNK